MRLLPEQNSAVHPTPRDASWVELHQHLGALARRDGVQVLFLGDSIFLGWGGQKEWEETYKPRKAVNIAIGGDRTENVLWRLENGLCEEIDPAAVVLMIGTNNAVHNTAPQIAEGIAAIVQALRSRLPRARILLLGILPRGERADTPIREKLRCVNDQIAQLADDKWVTYLDLASHFIEADGALRKDVIPDGVHPNINGYHVWAEAMGPTLLAMLE